MQKVFLWMVNQLTKEIETKIDEIIQEIENSDIYIRYLTLQKQIESNSELMELINRVKVMQKDVIHKKKKQAELDKLMDELNNNPLYREYSNSIYEINNTYGIIETTINNYFNKLMNQLSNSFFIVIYSSHVIMNMVIYYEK